MNTLIVGIIVLGWAGLITVVLAFCAAAGRADARDPFLVLNGTSSPKPSVAPRGRSTRFVRGVQSGAPRGEREMTILR